MAENSKVLLRDCKRHHKKRKDLAKIKNKEKNQQNKMQIF